MAEILAGRASEFADGDRRIIDADGAEIGVFRWEGQFYAYRNHCIHQGGPACEGLLMHKVQEVLAEDMTYHGMRWDPDEIHFVCPWHGYEFDLRNGECVSDRKLRLRSYPVEVRGDSVYVRTA